MRITSAKQLREEYNNSGYIYIAYCEDYPNIYKVGWTTHVIDKRINELQYIYNSKTKFECINNYKSKNAKNIEKIIHKKLKEFHYELKNSIFGNTKEFFKCDVDHIIKIILQCIEEDNNHRKNIETKCISIWKQSLVNQST